MSLRVFNFRSMLTPTSNRPLDAGNGKASSAQQRPAGKGALSGLSEFNANAAAANRANNRPTGANGAAGTEAVFVGQRPPASSQQPAVWRSSTQAGYGVHVPNVGTFLAANLDEAQALLGKHGVQFGATHASAPAQRPAPARLNIPSQKPNAGPQAMMVDSRPAATSRRPAVWPSSTQQGYGVHVPGSGAFRVGTLKEAKDLLDKHGIAFDAPGGTGGAPARPGAPPPLPPRRTSQGNASPDTATPSSPSAPPIPSRPQTFAPPTPPESPQMAQGARFGVQPQPLQAQPQTPSPSPSQSQEWLRMPEPDDHRLPASLIPGQGLPSSGPSIHPASLMPGRPTTMPSPPPTPPMSPQNHQGGRFDMPAPSAQSQPQEWLRMPEASNHRLPASPMPAQGLSSTALPMHPSSLMPGRPASPPTPPLTPPESPHNQQAPALSMPWPSAHNQQQTWAQMPAMPAMPQHDEEPQPTFLPLGRHQTSPNLATQTPETRPVTANTWPQEPAQSLANRPWATIPEGMEVKTWASPQEEALDRLGGPMVLSNVQPMDKKHYAGEEFGTKFGTSVKYLDEVERTAYQVTIHNGRLYSADGSLFDSRKGSSVFSGGSGSAIFVMDHKGNLYLSNHQAVGKFHHSSFLAGAPVAAAGEMVVHDGVIKSVSRRSGHYKPTVAQLDQCANHLKTQGVPPDFAVLSQV